jgi:SAM-dependent methyltransferase
MHTGRCRLCGAGLNRSFVDLGSTPLANSYPTAEQVALGQERSYRLHARVCDDCLLVQVDEAVPADAIFSADYAYFSSISTTWVAHARRYADAMIARFALGPQSLVMEAASNDGYLLQHFVARGVPVLGIEPAASVAAAAIAIGVPTEVTFFNADSAGGLAARHGRADLIAANNVLAHVPDLPGFVAGFAELLRPEGVATFEFPHLLNLIRQVQFDTIYHEHYTYLSLLVVERVLVGAGLRVFDVEGLSTHGGSLRVFCCRAGAAHPTQARVAQMRALETDAGLHRPEAYDAMAPKVAAVVGAFRDFVAAGRASGRRLAAYGAAAKGNTFLNACRVTASDILCVADRSPAKQGRLLPGSHLPVVAPDALAKICPDDVVILPWNIADEIAAELQPLRAAGCRFWVAVPELRQV